MVAELPKRPKQTEEQRRQPTPLETVLRRRMNRALVSGRVMPSRVRQPDAMPAPVVINRYAKWIEEQKRLFFEGKSEFHILISDDRYWLGKRCGWDELSEVMRAALKTFDIPEAGESAFWKWWTRLDLMDRIEVIEMSNKAAAADRATKHNRVGRRDLESLNKMAVREWRERQR